MPFPPRACGGAVSRRDGASPSARRRPRGDGAGFDSQTPASGQPPEPAQEAAAAGRGALSDENPRSRFTTVEEIWGQRTPLGTVVTIVTDGTVPAEAFSHFRLEGANPRQVIRLRGVDDRYRRASVPVSTGEVKQVRIGYHARPEGNELHVVLDLASPRVKLISSTPVDNRLELLLAVQ